MSDSSPVEVAKKADKIPSQYYPLLCLVALALFMQTLDSTAFSTALPAMAKTFGADPLQMQTVVVVYSITMAVVIPASGWLSDHYGTKAIFFVAILFFTIGALLSGSSTTLDWLIVSRIVQGIGGALLLPVGRLVVLKALPRELFLPAMGFIIIPGLFGPLLGPVLGGIISEKYSWRWIFYMNVPIGILTMLLTLKVMPNLKGEQIPFDWVGFLLLSASMLCLCLGFNGMGNKNAATHSYTLVLLIAGFVFLCTYALHASHKGRFALYDPALFKINSFRVGVLGNIFSRIGSGAMPFLLVLLYQVGFNKTPSQAGLMMIPSSLGAMVGKQFVTPLIDRWGYRTTLIMNTLLVGLSVAAFALLDGKESIWVDIVIIALFGIFNSMQFTAMSSVSLKDLDNKDASSGNSLLSMVGMVAMGISVAVAAAIMAGFNKYLGSSSGSTVSAFQATFVCLGIITGLSAWIYTQLRTNPIEREKQLARFETIENT